MDINNLKNVYNSNPTLKNQYSLQQYLDLFGQSAYTPIKPTPGQKEGITNIINSNLVPNIYQGNGGDGGDDDDDDNVNTNNAGINSFSDVYGAIRGNINIGSILGGIIAGPIGSFLGNKAYGTLGGFTQAGRDQKAREDAAAIGAAKQAALGNKGIPNSYTVDPTSKVELGPNENFPTTPAPTTHNKGSPGNYSCFIAGTKVTMADGTFKNIEDIKVGDKVKGHKDDNEVIKLDPTLLANRKLYSFNKNDHYFFTSEHPFMTEEGWKSVKPEKTKERDGIELYNQLEGELKIGDKLVTDKGLIEITDIKSKEINKPDMPLYNFNVSNDNSYIADGYVVHNKGGGGYGTYVCTASYANNLITPLDFKALKKYGIKLRRNDKYLMKAYDWFGPKLAAAVKKGKLVNFAKHSTSMWKYEQTKEDVSFKIKFMSRLHKIITRPIIRTVGVFLTIKEKLTK